MLDPAQGEFRRAGATDRQSSKPPLSANLWIVSSDNERTLSGRFAFHLGATFAMQRGSRSSSDARAAPGENLTRAAFRGVRSAAPTLACLVLCGAVAAFAQQDKASDHYRRGVELLEQGLWDPAILAFQEVLRLEPRQAGAYTAMGIAYRRKDAWEAAIEAFSKALAIAPESVEARFNLGLALRSAGRLDEGRAAIEAAVSRDPSAELMRLELGFALQQDGRWEESIAQFREILKRNPESAIAHYGRGIAHREQADFPRAIEQFRRAVEIDGELARAHDRLGAVLADSGEIRAAIAAFRKAVELKPEDLKFRMHLALALRTAGEGEQAVEQFDIVLARMRDSSARDAQRGRWPISSLAELYHYRAQARHAHDLNGAVADYEEALALNPGLPMAYYGLGQALKRLAGQAREARRRRPRVSAPDAGRLIREALGAIQGGDLQAARETLAIAVASAPRYAPARDWLGVVLSRQGDRDGAIRELTKSVELDPESAESRYLLGIALWDRGRREEAANQLETAVRLEPTKLEAYAFLGVACSELKRLDNARRFLTRAIALARDHPQLHFDLGAVFLRAGQSDKALGRFEAGLNLSSGDAAIPDMDAPIQLLRALIEARPAHTEARDILGRMLRRAGADPG